MNAGFPQPGQGLFFNKRLLIESGIDPETLYDMQANGAWTRDAFLVDEVFRAAPGYETVIYLEHYWKYNLDSRALRETIVSMIADALDMEPPKLEKGKTCEAGQMGEWWILLDNVEGRDD